MIKLTKKQIEILRVVFTAHKNDEKLDLDQLLERLPYSTTKESFQFSLRTLIVRGLLAKGERELRRNRLRTIVIPTVIALTELSAYIQPFKFSEDILYPEAEELLE